MRWFGEDAEGYQPGTLVGTRKGDIEMMKRLMLLSGGAIGYVLGARAGHERYEQITRQAQKLRANPTVQQKVSEAKSAAASAASTATEKVRSQAGSTKSSEPPADPLAVPVIDPYPDPVTGAPSSGFGRGDETI
jgi:hypothetical protein